MHYRMFGNIPGCYSLETSSIPTPSYDNRKYLQTLPSALWSGGGAKLPLVEKHEFLGVPVGRHLLLGDSTSLLTSLNTSSLLALATFAVPMGGPVQMRILGESDGPER